MGVQIIEKHLNIILIHCWTSEFIPKFQIVSRKEQFLLRKSMTRIVSSRRLQKDSNHNAVQTRKLKNEEAARSFMDINARAEVLLS